MMKQLAASVTTPAETVITFSTKMNGGGNGARQTTNKKKVSPGLHVCTHCKQYVYHKDGNYLELE